jgi:hypothetical protein
VENEQDNVASNGKSVQQGFNQNIITWFITFFFVYCHFLLLKK